MSQIKSVGAYITRPLRAQTLQAAVLLTVFILIFLSTPLTQGGYYAATDFLQYYELYRTAPAQVTPKNPILTDLVFQMIPNLHWNREQLWHSSLPLWNPYNGWGVPHLANYQSAVFSPFSLPSYILGFHAGLLVTAFLKLFVLGFFTYLFLCQTAVQQWAAVLGAVAFMFSGYPVLYLGWPHSAAAVTLPMGLYFAERSFQHATERILRIFDLLGFSSALTVGLLSGHPETFFFCVLILGAYLLFRLFETRNTWRSFGERLIEFTLAGVLALAVSAVQLLPFFEYLNLSTALSLRSEQTPYIPLPMQLTPLQAFPNLLGSPALPYQDPALMQLTSNYIGANNHYIGVMVLFLSGLTVLTLPWHRLSTAGFFAIISFLWLVYSYNILGIGRHLSELPGLNLAFVLRSSLIWLFSLSSLSALGLHVLTRKCGEQRAANRFGLSRVGMLAITIAWACMLVVGAFFGAYSLIQWAATQPGNLVGSPAAQQVVLPHLAFVGGTSIIGIIIVVVLLAREPTPHPTRLVTLLCGCLVVLVFFQSGFLLKDFNPTIDGRYFYPVTPAFAQINAQTRDEQTLRLDCAGTPANTNLWYQMRSISNYDALGVRTYDTLRKRFVSQPTEAAEFAAKVSSLRGLQLLGVRYIVTCRPYPFAEPAVDTPQPISDVQPLAVPPGPGISESFSASANQLGLLTIPITTFGRINKCTLQVSLDDITSGQRIAQKDYSCSDFRGEARAILSFPPQPESKGRKFRLSVVSSETARDQTVGVVSALRSRPGELLFGESSSDRMVLFEAYTVTIPGLVLAWVSDPFKLFRVPNALPRFFVAGHGVSVHGDEEAFAILERPETDIGKQIVIHEERRAARAGSPGQFPVRVFEEGPTYIHLRVDQPEPGWVVALKTFYPGWKGLVNGQPVTPLRANVAFTAIPVGGGLSDVILYYDPASVKIGAIISAIALIVLLPIAGLVFLPRLGRRR